MMKDLLSGKPEKLYSFEAYGATWKIELKSDVDEIDIVESDKTIIMLDPTFGGEVTLDKEDLYHFKRTIKFYILKALSVMCGTNIVDEDTAIHWFTAIQDEYIKIVNCIE